LIYIYFLARLSYELLAFVLIYNLCIFKLSAKFKLQALTDGISGKKMKIDQQ